MQKKQKKWIALIAVGVILILGWSVIGYTGWRVYKGYIASTESTATETKTADAKTTDAKTTEAKPADKKVDTKVADTKSAEPKVDKSAEPAIEPIKKADAKPAETKPADKPAEPVKVATAMSSRGEFIKDCEAKLAPLSELPWIAENGKVECAKRAPAADKK